MPTSGKPAKLREAQLQLQRKLQQREHIRDQKHRHLDTIVQVDSIHSYLLQAIKQLYNLIRGLNFTLPNIF